jgi:hypothetical protein
MNIKRETYAECTAEQKVSSQYIPTMGKNKGERKNIMSVKTTVVEGVQKIHPV